jgi:hypothetical protein
VVNGIVWPALHHFGIPIDNCHTLIVIHQEVSRALSALQATNENGALSTPSIKGSIEFKNPDNGPPKLYVPVPRGLSYTAFRQLEKVINALVIFWTQTIRRRMTKLRSHSQVVTRPRQLQI